MWGVTYSHASLISLALSILLNAALLLIILVRVDKVASYRRFFYFYCLLDVVFSAAQYIMTPFFWSTKGFIVAVAASKDSMSTLLMKVGLALWLLAVMLIAILVAASFVYRYAAASGSPILLSLFERPSIMFLVVVLSLCATCGPLMVLFTIGYPPTRAARIEMLRQLNQEYGVNYIRGFFIGADFIDTTSYSASLGIIVITAAIVLIFVACLIIIIACIIGIRRAIVRKKAGRDRARLRLSLIRLICQALNPLLFLYLPLLYRLIPFLIDFPNPELIHWILSFFFLLFPLLNPVIILAFTPDYLKYIKNTFKYYTGLCQN